MIVQSLLTDSPVRLILGGACIGIGISTFVLAEALRRLGAIVHRDVDPATHQSGNTNRLPLRADQRQ